MARQLDVYLRDRLVGMLSQDNHGDIGFCYAPEWLGSSFAIGISQSLPLRSEPFSRRECSGFFGGILPEGEQREVIARNLGISGRNDVAMLDAIGGECAGAITFLTVGTSPPISEAHYEPLTSPDIAAKLRRLPRRPLLAGDDHIRLSLAGAQHKLAVRISKDVVSLPLYGAPSTHILKPAVDRFPGIVQNECLCMRLASAVGLPTANVEMRNAENIEYLEVERYDRFLATNDELERLHQEDFCQALGVISEHKYQNEGGPSFSDCVTLIRSACATPAVDVLRFTDGFIFNYLIGNNDAHAKNYSLLYTGWPRLPLRIAFAPLYDLVCTRYYSELSPRMAMKIDDEYEPDKVYPRQFERLADEARVNKTALKRRIIDLAQTTLSKLPSVTPQDEVSVKVAAIIQERCKRTAGMFGN